MECQVNVGQDGGDRVEGDYKGKMWHGWTDGASTWKSFRIPYKAKSSPEFTDSPMAFDLVKHVEGIGMTGWDWKNQVSKWVAYDFDDVTGHSEKHAKILDATELAEVKRAAMALDFVTVRKSTGGKGLHLYVMLPDVPTANHTEHAALARAILGQISALTGFNFQVKVDVCGGNMWVWHRKMSTENGGLQLLKQGDTLADFPPNWRDHVKIISRPIRKNNAEDAIDPFQELAGRRPRVALGSEHIRLVTYLRENNCVWWWDSDLNMLVTHTIHLAEAHSALALRGTFKTISTGTEKGIDHNCFAFPLRDGSWIIRRYTQGVAEDASWTQDGSGWTTCYYNREPDFATACRAAGGIEDPTGGFRFAEAERAQAAATSLGVDFQIGLPLHRRNTLLRLHKDGRLVVCVDREMQDRPDDMPGWLATNNKPWTRICSMRATAPTEPEVGNYDDLSRHLVTPQEEDYGWVIRSDGKWRTEPIAHVKMALRSLGIGEKDANIILGTSVFKAWTMVNKPFQPEYTGDREWNRDAAQLRYLPSGSENPKCETWNRILRHCGSGLDMYLERHPWALANGIKTGADYLKCWIASLFQAPEQPLPYLFFWGSENSGKSIFHESLELLVTKGYQKADLALTSQSGFNGELEGAIICVIEEVDLSANKTALNRIKDWVTSPFINIRHMYKSPYHARNTCHWVQCANRHTFCPIFPGDTRITMCHVPTLDPLDLIPKKQLIPMLQSEAPDFLTELLGLELPESNDRLNIPVITTAEKEQVASNNQSSLIAFIEEFCKPAPGAVIKFSEFWSKFESWVDPTERLTWSKIRVGKELPPGIVKGRLHRDGQHYIGNIFWADAQPVEVAPTAYEAINGFLELR